LLRCVENLRVRAKKQGNLNLKELLSNIDSSLAEVLRAQASHSESVREVADFVEKGGRSTEEYLSRALKVKSL